MASKEIRTITPPAQSAGPDTVREYVSQVLVTKYSASPKDASDAASNWRLGNGRDFLAVQPGDFKNIFGTEFGHLIYGSLQDDMRREWHESRIGKISTGMQHTYSFEPGLALGLN